MERFVADLHEGGAGRADLHVLVRQLEDCAVHEPRRVLESTHVSADGGELEDVLLLLGGYLDEVHGFLEVHDGVFQIVRVDLERGAAVGARGILRLDEITSVIEDEV